MNRYRIARHKYANPNTDEVTHSFGVVDAYYNHNGEVTSISELPFIYPVGESLNELREDMLEFIKATFLPIIDYDSFEEIKNGSC